VTARPDEEESRVPHKLYGILGAEETPSAGKWLKFAKMEIDWVLAQGMLPIVVGGTGLYLKALMEGMAEMPDIPAEVRRQAVNDYEAMGKAAFEERLRHVDPQFFERLKVYDRQRLLRAYEVWLGTGKSLTYWQQQKMTHFYPPESFEVQKIEVDRKTLYARCDARFISMMEQGATEEVRLLSERCDLSTASIGKVIGVPEIWAYIKGELTREKAIEQAQQATRNYAKRQMTWFRNQLKR